LDSTQMLQVALCHRFATETSLDARCSNASAAVGLHVAIAPDAGLVVSVKKVSLKRDENVIVLLPTDQ
jgi:hypothetical protein